MKIDLKRNLVYMSSAIAAVITVQNISPFVETSSLSVLPRIQFFILSCIFIIPLFIWGNRYKYSKLLSYSAILAFVINLYIQGNALLPYTPLVPVEVPNATELKSGEHQINLLITNVDGYDPASLLYLVSELKPDIIIAIETKSWSDKQLSPLNNDYFYTEKHNINEFGYGMMIFSKLALEDIRIRFIQNENVPAIESTIVLNDDKKVKLYAVHPLPLASVAHVPNNEQKIEMEIIGKEVSEQQLPTIIAGSFDDAIWSEVDELTNTQNLLYDVRVGRGFYTSYHTNRIFLKWPLDHVFVTKEFKLKSLEKLYDIGSDHFPIYVELVL